MVEKLFNLLQEYAYRSPGDTAFLDPKGLLCLLKAGSYIIKFKNSIIIALEYVLVLPVLHSFDDTRIQRQLIDMGEGPIPFK